ncbi:MAG: hypothetical protein WBD31_03760 [Rubripirellula sp.]
MTYMQTLNRQRITNIEFLLSVRPERLVKFLSPYRDYLASCGWTMPDAGTIKKEKIESLAALLQVADTDAPTKMLDSLHTISGLANRVTVSLLFDQIEGLLQTFHGQGKPFPGDVAIEAYMLDPDAAEKILSIRSGTLRRSYVSYQAATEQMPTLPDDLEARLNQLTNYLDLWFDERGCGPGANVKYVEDSSHLFLTIEHGTPMKRQRTLNNGLRDCLIFRPALDDFAVIDKLIWELRINAETSSQRDIYRRQIGKIIFDDENLFPDGERYTLNPLLAYGRKCLSVSAIPGLSSVECCGVKMLLPGHEPEEISSRRRNVIDVLDDRIMMLKAAGFTEIRLTEAKFRMLFSDSRRTRMVTIKPPNVAVFSRDGDAAIVEHFLAANGFITNQDVDPYDLPRTSYPPR